MSTQAIELRKERVAINKQMEDLYAVAKAEGRSTLNADEEVQWNKMLADIDRKGEEVKRLEKREALAKEFALEDFKKEERTEPKKSAVTYDMAFENALRRGYKSLNTEERAMIETRGTATNIAATDGLGGYLVPDSWSSNLIESMKMYGGVLANADIMTTSGFGTLNIPKTDNTTSVGARISEGAADTVSDLAFTNLQLDAYEYTSKIIKLSWVLLGDNAYDLQGKLSGFISERIGRIINQEFTTGTGSAQPNGIVTASTLGKTAASATAITISELLDLIHSVDPAYRFNGKLMFNDSTLLALRKLTLGASDATPLWGYDIRTGAPDKLLGYDYVINNDMPSIATGEKSIIFGDFKKYTVRQVQDIKIARSDERYFEERSSGFFGYARFDGDLVDTAAVKHLIQA